MKCSSQKIFAISLFFSFMAISIPSISAEQNEPEYNIEPSVDFHGVDWILPQTHVPVSVVINNSYEGNSSHMVAIHFVTDGNSDYFHGKAKTTSYIPSFEENESVEVQSTVLMSRDTTELVVEVEVLLCKENPCNMTQPPGERFENEPHSTQTMTIYENLPQIVNLVTATPLHPYEEVPRFIFTFDEENAENELGFWRIEVAQAQKDFPVQVMQLCMNWVDSNGEVQKEIWSLINQTVYGFNPQNIDTRVTFFDYVLGGEAYFGTGDTIFIRSQNDDGTLIDDFGISLVHHVDWGETGAVIRSWGGGCTHDWDDDGVSHLDAFPFDPKEQSDTDEDGVGDNADKFPNDASETTDSDGDGVGDNADKFPNNASETIDSDGDGVGDNADAYPNDASKSAKGDDGGDDDSSVGDILPHAGSIATLSVILLASFTTLVLNRRQI